ncbi:MAG TPA: glycosyltransferase family 2 protein [Longimicrobiales bacterium]|nr:glycosyltransferase family 2 protein [Longimicrobiales bacterium]
MTTAEPAAASISVCIACRNEADRLGPCLESVAWSDDVIVMDLESSDGSAELAARHGAQVVRRAPVPIVEIVRNEIAAHARHDWILVLDPDERITPGLADALREVAGIADVHAVVVPRMNYDFGHAPSSPLQRYEPQLRMYRRSAVAWPEIPNALPQVPEPYVYHIPARDELVMVHERSRTVPEVIDRVVRYAPLQAQSMIDRGEVFTARRMIGTLGEATYRHLIVGRAWRDGVPGLMRAGVLVGFKFYVWAAFWQLSGSARTPEDDRYVHALGRWMEGPRAALGLASRVKRLLRRRGHEGV